MLGENVILKKLLTADEARQRQLSSEVPASGLRDELVGVIFDLRFLIFFLSFALLTYFPFPSFFNLVFLLQTVCFFFFFF